MATHFSINLYPLSTTPLAMHTATTDSLSPAASFDRVWQGLPASPSADATYHLLVDQLRRPAFAVPVADPVQPGGRAFAQTLFAPISSDHHLREALQRLLSDGLILPFHVNLLRTNAGFLAILVVRSDDPAVAAQRHEQGGDACSAGTP